MISFMSEYSFVQNPMPEPMPLIDRQLEKFDFDSGTFLIQLLFVYDTAIPSLMLITTHIGEAHRTGIIVQVNRYGRGDSGIDGW